MAARIDTSLALNGVGHLLSADDEYVRSQAAKAVIRLLELDLPSELVVEVARQIASLVPPEWADASDSQTALLKALASCLAVHPQPVTDVIFEAMRERGTQAARPLARAWTFEEAMRSEHRPWVPQLLRLVGDASEGVQLRHALAMDIDDIARCYHGALWESFDLLLAALKRVAEERSRMVADTHAIGMLSVEEFSERELNQSLLDGIAGHLEQALAMTCLVDPRLSIEGLVSALDGGEDGLPEAKASVLAVLGELGHQATFIAGSIVAAVYPHLAAGDPSVRAAAAGALSDLSSWNRDALPEDVVREVAQLLSDEYLVPVVDAAIRVLARSVVAEQRLAVTVMSQLLGLYLEHGDDPRLPHLVPNLVDAQLNLVAQHPFLVPSQLESFRVMSGSRHHRSANAVMERYGKFVQPRPDTQPDFVRAVLGCHERFNREFSLGHDSLGFAAFYGLDPAVIRAHSRRLVAFAEGSPSHHARLLAATVLLLAADAAAPRVFELAAEATRSAGGRDPGWSHERSRGVAYLIRGERALEENRRDAAIDAFWSATQHLDRALTTRRSSARGTAVGSDAEGHADWGVFRQTWLKTSAAASSSDQWGRLRESLHVLPMPTHERDRRIYELADALVESAHLLTLWHADIRAAVSSTAARRDAVIARLCDARRSAESLSSTDSATTPPLVARLAWLVERAKALDAGTSIEPLLIAMRDTPLPVPLGDLPRPPEPMAQRGTAYGSDGNTQVPRSHEEPQAAIALISMALDGQPANKVSEIAAGRLYDLTISLELDGPPPKDSLLRIQAVSKLPPEAFEFPGKLIGLDGGTTTLTIGGIMLFKHPQSETSAPVEIKVLVELQSEQGSMPVELLGARTLRLRVRESVDDASGFGEEPSPIVLRIPLELENGRSGVYINGRPCPLTAANFERLLVLALALHTSTSGAVRLGRAEHPLTAGYHGYFPEEHQHLYPLRRALAAAIAPVSATDFIRTADSTVGLALDAKQIELDWDGLASHPNANVRALIARARDLMSGTD